MSSEPNHNRQKNHKALTKKQKEAIRRKKRQRTYPIPPPIITDNISPIPTTINPSLLSPKIIQSPPINNRIATEAAAKYGLSSTRT